ncbi:MAG: hypothetical protein CMQ51_00940 [Gammaproteobacteria bacterium]|nr:hypothetical protein [Gammaproteobacteria bacterium]PPR66314.1 MAG: hypothetical protein CFH08_00028 [Alphaproteobacteria bacterium MarineAlpha3_Bin7]|tara:strand:+ start:431 stop:946 length:516 start_codon:yes stop_codon:yes gene_type:complete
MSKAIEAPKPVSVGKIGREINSVLLSIIVLVLIVMFLDISFSMDQFGEAEKFLNKFVGIAWPFFVIVSLFINWVFGAWLTEVFVSDSKRDWSKVVRYLDWAAEACPYVGLLTTFFTFLRALLVYSDAGPGNPETQAAFIKQFAIAFGSSITGGVLALAAFTLGALVTGGRR